MSDFDVILLGGGDMQASIARAELVMSAAGESGTAMTVEDRRR